MIIRIPFTKYRFGFGAHVHSFGPRGKLWLLSVGGQ